MIDRHSAPRDGKTTIWAWIDGKPTEILFLGLLPYNGFEYLLPTDTEDTFKPPKFEDMEIGKSYELVSCRTCKSEAIFAATERELIEDRITKLRDEMSQLRLNIYNLEKHLATLPPKPIAKSNVMTWKGCSERGCHSYAVGGTDQCLEHGPFGQ